MKKDLELHPVQSRILRELLFKPHARFSELNLSDLTSDHFNFHVKALLEAGLVEKNSDNQYTLTRDGKEFANRFDTDKVKIEKQAKLCVVIKCQKEENGETHYLMQQRLKHPYFGYHGFATGKISWGETVLETAARELKEETGLDADLELIAIKHKMDQDPKDNLLEDKYFFVFRGTNTRGDLIENFEGGRNFWATKAEILALPNQFNDLPEGMDLLENTAGLEFIEKKYIITDF